jgi:hypothetical protein
MGSLQHLLCYLVTEARKQTEAPSSRSETVLQLLVENDVNIDEMGLDEAIKHMPSVSSDHYSLLEALDHIFLDADNWSRGRLNGRGESCIRIAAHFRGLQYRRR